MVDNIVFNDFDVTVEIYDSVIAKWVLTDYAETNPASTAYLRNRDLIQPKLTAGTNITISEDNEISADICLDQMKHFISHDLKNELKLGTDQLLYVGFSGLLRNGGDVETREDLPYVSDPFIAHMIKDENIIVFAYQDVTLGLVWLPLSFYVDMNLYVSKEELSTEAAPIIEAHNTNEGAHPFILTALEEIREEMTNKEHFRGYYATTAEVLAITNPETGDFAYNAQTGTKWVYDSATGWSDSLVPVPDQMVEPYDGNPLMDGVASAGSVDKYSRGDHRHATDTSRAPLLHSSSATSYGMGNATLYGHLKLSDATNSTESSENGIAATPEAVRLTNVALATETSNRTAADVQTLTDAKSYADSVVSGVTVARDLDAEFATFDPAVLSDVSAQAVGNSQLLITFTPVADITPAETPYTVFSDADTSILPTLKLRFGQVWDYAKVEQVGFCVFDQDGDLTINLVAKLFAGTPYTLLV